MLDVSLFLFLRNFTIKLLLLGDALYRLRLKLSEVTGDKSFREEEKDPTEFLRTLENLFEFAPLKTIPPNQQPSSNRSNITSNIMCKKIYSSLDSSSYLNSI